MFPHYKYKLYKTRETFFRDFPKRTYQHISRKPRHNVASALHEHYIVLPASKEPMNEDATNTKTKCIKEGKIHQISHQLHLFSTFSVLKTLIKRKRKDYSIIDVFIHGDLTLRI